MSGKRDRSQRPGFRIGPGREFRPQHDDFEVSKAELRKILENTIELLDDDEYSAESVLDALLEELEDLK